MNTYEKVIDYLKSYKKLEYDVEFYRHKMEGIKAISYSIEEKGTAVEDMMIVYMEKIEQAESKMHKIEEFIENNFTDLDRLIIHDKFINNMTYESISKNVGYSTSHIKRLLNRAIYKYLSKR